MHWQPNKNKVTPMGTKSLCSASYCTTDPRHRFINVKHRNTLLTSASFAQCCWKHIFLQK